MKDPETVLLVRVTELNGVAHAFADSLQAASGLSVAYVVDARSRPDRSGVRPVITVSRAACESIGLHCPEEFAWSCGDYGYYLARRALPSASRFWLIEHDVRFSGDGGAEFFQFFSSRKDVDLLTSYLRDAESNWDWIHTTTARRGTGRRCFFPVTRLSSRAIDVLFERRRSHAADWSRRKVWPNDEAMVATTCLNAGLICRDINSFGRTFYRAETFSYHNVLDGDSIDWSAGPTQLHHPVLYGQAFQAKQRLMAAVVAAGPTRGRRPIERLATCLNSMKSW